MTETPATDGAAHAAGRAKRNRRTAMVSLFVVFGMVGATFAAVPLYEIFCQVTGYGGTTQRADAASDRILDRMVKVQFDANIDPALGWTFEPAQRSVNVHLGETALIDYTAVNNSGHDTVGTAVFNVTPESVGRYFSKIQCFCFTEQRLAAGESATLPVLFFVDPALADDPILDYIDTITLSYTFYPATPAPGPVAGAGTAGAG
ncbi:MAG: cytochrome c oxidase assembly protein [Bauldia sp.]|nr:cytochrome c oxidase assembly protein [Bauldia sp.]